MTLAVGIEGLEQFESYGITAAWERHIEVEMELVYFDVIGVHNRRRSLPCLINTAPSEADIKGMLSNDSNDIREAEDTGAGRKGYVHALTVRPEAVAHRAFYFKLSVMLRLFVDLCRQTAFMLVILDANCQLVCVFHVKQ